MMNRKEAFDVLGVKPGANKYEIERRYSVLAKSYRGRTDEAARAEIQRFTLAYDILTGRYVEPEPEDPRMDDVILGMTRREWKTKWLYARIPILIAVIVLGVIGSIVYSIVSREDPDYVMQVYGTFVATEDASDNGEAFLKDSFAYLDTRAVPSVDEDGDPIEPTLDLPSVVIQPYHDQNDAQMNYMASMKFLLIMSGADETDLLVVDRALYEQSASQGALGSLDHLYEALAAKYPEAVERYVEPLRMALDEPERQPDDAEGEHIYGLDLSRMQPLNHFGIYGGTQIFTQPVRAQSDAMMFAVLSHILDQAETLAMPEAELLPTPTITPTPVPMSEDAS